jgi:magnesium-transporting ATPase (P-type)
MSGATSAMSLSSSSGNNNKNNIKAAAYPYTRAEECSWQPEEVARHLAALAMQHHHNPSSSSSSTTATVGSSNGVFFGGDSSHHHATSSSMTSTTHLLSHGWSSRQIPSLRKLYGANQMKGDVSSGNGNDSNHLGGYFASYRARTSSYRNHNNSNSNSNNNNSNSNNIFLRLLHHIYFLSLGNPCLRSNSAILSPILSALYGQLKEPLILMLLGSAGISILLGNAADAISIAIALLIVSLVAAVQEYRSEQALEKLSNLVPHSCTVLRDGQVQDHFLARDLVVGDLILLSTGDRVPADCRVVDSVELTLDESSLTGENHPTDKTGEGLVALGIQPTLTQQRNIVFTGTLVNAGRGRAIVVAVGNETEFGKVAQELSTVTNRKSPLQNKIDELGQRLATLSSMAIAVIALLGYIMGRPLLETLTVAVR